MRVDITEFEKVYSFELLPITQLCGQNIVRKTYILESFRRYFSTYKYKEEQNKWRDNIKIDGAVVGRKYFEIFSIKNVSDIISAIKYSKQSLMTEYLKQVIQNFELQKHMDSINNELEEIFRLLNNDINQLGGVEMSYSMADIWDMVQKSDVSGSNQTALDNKNNYELIEILLNLIEKVLGYNPRKEVVILENIDHFLSPEEYTAVIAKLNDIVKKFNVYFILTTSLEGYVECDKDIFSGITVFGNIDFQMPEFEDILHFICDNYPCNKDITEEKLKMILKKIIHRIGQRNYLCSVEENVICKLLNQTLMINEKSDFQVTILEKAFLKS